MDGWGCAGAQSSLPAAIGMAATFNEEGKIMKRTNQIWLTFTLAAAIIDPAHAAEAVLHNFGSPPKGAGPYGGVIQDSAGNLFGTTTGGGTAGDGVVFKVDPSGRETVLHNFSGADGVSPEAGLIRDSSGNLYGTTVRGGVFDAGVVFKLDATGAETVLYSFCAQSGCADGSNPNAGVVRDASGNLYGTTTWGGASGNGTVYKLDTTGHQTVLYSFNGGADGGRPFGGVVLGPSGNLYGTT